MMNPESGREGGREGGREEGRKRARGEGRDEIPAGREIATNGVVHRRSSFN